MLVDERGKKLSKRKHPVAVEDYRDKGYLPEAFRNYLALLGWSPKGDAEIVPVETLIEQFRLEDVHHAPAFFDVKKFTHMNGVYIRELPVEEFIERSKPWVAPELGSGRRRPPVPRGRGALRRGHLRPARTPRPGRVATLGEVPAMVDFIFLADPPTTRPSSTASSCATRGRSTSWTGRWRSTRTASGGRRPPRPHPRDG